MTYTIGKSCLALCLLFIYVARVNSLVCMKCADGKCDKPEEETCAAPVVVTKPPTTTAKAPGGDAPLPPAADPFMLRAQRFIQHADTFKCATYTLKDKIYRGCTADDKCTDFKTAHPDGDCKTCDKDKCNTGFTIKPMDFIFMMSVTLICLLVSRN